MLNFGNKRDIMCVCLQTVISGQTGDADFSEVIMNCSKCGKKIADNSYACPYCATVVQRDQEEYELPVIDSMKPRSKVPLVVSSIIGGVLLIASGTYAFSKIGVRKPPIKPGSSGSPVSAVLSSSEDESSSSEISKPVSSSSSSSKVSSTEIIYLDDDDDETETGEIFFHDTDPEHIAVDDDGSYYADNELLLVAYPDTEFSYIENAVREYDGQIVGWIEQTGDFQIALPDKYTTTELKAIADDLVEDDEIRTVSINAIFDISTSETASPEGFYYGEKWSVDFSGRKEAVDKNFGWEVINTRDAWTLLDKKVRESSAAEPVKLGLIDDGFQLDHEDLGFGEDFGKYSKSVMEHGTHVAGTMAAKTDDETGICGVYPYGDGNLYGVSWWDYSLNSSFSSCMMEKCLLAKLIFSDVKVINCSYGFTSANVAIESFGSISTKEYVDFNAYLLGDYLDRVLKLGYDYCIVVSAGNDNNAYYTTLTDGYKRLIYSSYGTAAKIYEGTDSSGKKAYYLADDFSTAEANYPAGTLVYNESDLLSAPEIHYVSEINSKYTSLFTAINEEDYPAVYNRIITVGAMDSKLKPAYYSNGMERADIYAPGGDGEDLGYSWQILSSFPGNSYGEMSGTSMAAPHVSGTAAMVWTANNTLSGAQVKEIICKDSNRNDAADACHLIDAYKCVADADNYNDTVEYNGHIYRIYNENTSWTGAEKYCEDAGGHLVSITSEDEQKFIESIIKDTGKMGYWIGLYRDGDSWSWTDGSEYSFTAWDTDDLWGTPKPDNHYGNEDYVCIYSDTKIYKDSEGKDAWKQNFGGWDDTAHDPFSYDHNSEEFDISGFICEWDEKW